MVPGVLGSGIGRASGVGWTLEDVRNRTRPLTRVRTSGEEGLHTTPSGIPRTRVREEEKENLSRLHLWTKGTEVLE